MADLDTATDEELAAAHSLGLQALGHRADAAGSPSLLDVKIELSRRALSDCRLCPHACGVDRLAGERGFCAVGAETHVAAEMVHLGELPDLVPAYSVFLGGCTMRCLYCRKPDLLQRPDEGDLLQPERFARDVAAGARDGARTLKLLGGTPEPHVHAILRGLQALDVSLPVMWESTIFIAPQCLELIRGCVDLFIANVRYGNDDCARELSGVAEYVQPAMAALREASRWADVALRHLVLPGHIDCCTAPLAEMLEDALPDTELVLLMQYVPFWRAWERPELSRRLSEEERRHAVEVVSERKRLWSVGQLV
ncbi:MAG: radical SAM protein [Armatimonadota bacterium]|nr:radical SAM protein [Armatimonadota bacterium]